MLMYLFNKQVRSNMAKQTQEKDKRDQRRHVQSEAAYRTPLQRRTQEAATEREKGRNKKKEKNSISEIPSLKALSTLASRDDATRAVTAGHRVLFAILFTSE